ncbi:hypothetical protein AMTRI_Chr05g72220 [Amborella trichopoda]
MSVGTCDRSFGGIWVIWDPTDHLLTSHLGDFSVTILLSRLSDGLAWKFSIIYGPCNSTCRPRFWSELDYIAALSHPTWCLGGDFNITRWSHERNTSSRVSQSMLDFSDFISKTNLLDIPLQGNRFTWSSPSSQPSLSKLGRFLLNPEWEEEFLGSHAMALPKLVSDHSPILLSTLPLYRGPKPFRFELSWLEERSLSTLIPTWWNSFPTQIKGRIGFRLQSKIQLLKASLKSWRSSVSGNYSQINSDLLKTLQDLDNIEESRLLSSSEAKLRTQTKLNYLSTLKKEEIYWYQRSRVNWLKTGAQ